MKNKINSTVFVLNLMFTAILFSSNFGQNKSVILQRNERASTCEYIKNRLDYSLIESKKNKDSYTTLLFRPGKMEKQVGIIDLRIKMISDYLENKNGNLNQFKVVTGEPVSDLGKVEIYIEGKLFSEMVFKKNKSDRDFCVE